MTSLSKNTSGSPYRHVSFLSSSLWYISLLSFSYGQFFYNKYLFGVCVRELSFPLPWHRCFSTIKKKKETFFFKKNALMIFHFVILVSLLRYAVKQAQRFVLNWNYTKRYFYCQVWFTVIKSYILYRRIIRVVYRRHTEIDNLVALSYLSRLVFLELSSASITNYHFLSIKGPNFSRGFLVFVFFFSNPCRILSITLSLKTPAKDRSASCDTSLTIWRCLFQLLLLISLKVLVLELEPCFFLNYWYLYWCELFSLYPTTTERQDTQADNDIDLCFEFKLKRCFENFKW